MPKSDHKHNWPKRNIFSIPLALLEGWHPLEQDRQLNTYPNFIMTVHLHPRGFQHLGARWHTASSVCLMAVLSLSKLLNQCFGAASQGGCGNGWGCVGNGKSQLDPSTFTLITPFQPSVLHLTQLLYILPVYNEIYELSPEQKIPDLSLHCSLK